MQYTNNSIFVLVWTDLEEMEKGREGVGWSRGPITIDWLLKDDGVIILGSSNYIHHHTCYVNAHALTGAEIRSRVMLCLEM